MTYFKDIHSLEDLRKEYKRLVKANHPEWQQMNRFGTLSI